MPRPAPRMLEVVRSQHLTPNILRVTLGGPGLATFPENQESAYIKLILPREEGAPLMRTYTIATQRSREIDVDFALHAARGPATDWALSARPGDPVMIGGPGPSKLINRDADWFLLAGDMTALPAIRVNVALLPRDAMGYIVLEVAAPEDVHPLGQPPGMALHWVVNNGPDAQRGPFLDCVQQLPWLPGQAAVWAACEFSNFRALRRYFKQERAVDKSRLYVSSYWKQGCSEDQHKLEKSADARASDD